MRGPQSIRRIRTVAVFAFTGTLAVAAAGTGFSAQAASGATDSRAAKAPAATPFTLPGSAGQSALGDTWQPQDPRTGLPAARPDGGLVPGEVVLRLTVPADTVLAGPAGPAGLPGVKVEKVRQVAPDTVVATLDTSDTVAAAARLATVPGVLQAAPNRYVSSMISGSTPLPKTLTDAVAKTPQRTTAPKAPTADAAALPANFGITSSLQSYLNSGGVDALAAYSELGSRYHQLPGAGEIITNVCVGDLTDASMTDDYVQANGPTTVVRDGQRYLDLPSMPLIPTYVSDAAGTLDPLGSTEGQDAQNGEILLDFGVMAPLPHDKQRPEATGSQFTDLLGIAPGATYRLVVPQTPTMDQIATALLAAAKQSPRPDVINASLGFGTDTVGFPGRYLEDDPVLQSTIATIVRQYGITVTVAANDGTRLYTPAAVGPDGGSTPTDLAHDAKQATSIDDDALSTTPSRIVDSGAIAVGGSTTDDVLAGGVSGTPVVAETRISGGGDFSSGFGDRVNLSAPSDNIPSFVHAGGTAQSVGVVLTGGTSASAPETAAAAAVLDQAAKLAGRQLTPAQIRDTLVRTARAVPTPGQIDRQLHVGPQLDVTAAVESVLPRVHGDGTTDGASDTQGTGTQGIDTQGTDTQGIDTQGVDGQGADNAQGHAAAPRIVRLGIAHRQLLGDFGGAFVEYTDPGAIDLAGPLNGRGYATGEGLVGPITFAADVVGAGTKAAYSLTVGTTTFTSDTPAIRVTPTQLLTAAGLPVASTAPRTVQVTFTVRKHGAAPVSTVQTLTLGPSDGTNVEAAAPTAPATAAAGQSVTVHYDLSSVRGVAKPSLVVSTVGHWNPTLAPLFNQAWSTPLTAAGGDITIPASAFTSGGGIYGIAIVQNGTNAANPVYGESAPIRIAGGTADTRAPAPTLAAVGQRPGHQATITRAHPAFSVRYSVDDVHGARGAMLEISAPGPTLYNALNTFTAQNGTGRDHDGFDSGSVVYQKLPGKEGTAQLDALKLGLSTSVTYNVRVVPVDAAGNPAGQASPSSGLEIDDGLAPGGGGIGDFAIAGADSVAVTAAVAGEPGTAVRHYDPATGDYGMILTSDPADTAQYGVIGVDDEAHSVALVHWKDADTVTFEVWSLATGKEIGTPIALPPSQDVLLGGRVDARRHRAALLTWTMPGGADTLLPIDMATGAAAAPIALDAGLKQDKFWFDGVDLDVATGIVQVAHLGGGGICIGGGAGDVANVDLDARTVTPSKAGSACGVHLASSQTGGDAWTLVYSSISVNFPGTTRLLGLDEKTLSVPLSPASQRQGRPMTLAVDEAHQVAVVAYPTPQAKVVFGVPGGVLTDTNSMSQLDVVDLATGKVLKTLAAQNFRYTSQGAFPGVSPMVQLDPATRSGWTYAPNGTQIQRFTY
ncbi:peptidase S8 [Catenulispora subtropica]|uniref:Peptidase S8 and S53 subtilisin kexin sedolisin n=1 Tax=Catenulispora subtropica TaxID=450798 RepID=A0ABP5CQF9_9ACTN